MFLIIYYNMKSLLSPLIGEIQKYKTKEIMSCRIFDYLFTKINILKLVKFLKMLKPFKYCIMTYLINKIKIVKIITILLI